MNTPKPPMAAALVPMLPAAAYTMPESPNITTLPHTVVDLIGNHITVRLNDLVKVKKSHWKGNVKTTFSKRQYIYDK
eukprot:7511773-Ditylum_brightwellii.AAC.1